MLHLHRPAAPLQWPPVPVGELLCLVQASAQHLLHQKAEAPWAPCAGLVHSRGWPVCHPQLQDSTPRGKALTWGRTAPHTAAAPRGPLTGPVPAMMDSALRGGAGGPGAGCLGSQGLRAGSPAHRSALGPTS